VNTYTVVRYTWQWQLQSAHSTRGSPGDVMVTSYFRSCVLQGSSRDVTGDASCRRDDVTVPMSSSITIARGDSDDLGVMACFPILVISAISVRFRRIINRCVARTLSSASFSRLIAKTHPSICRPVAASSVHDSWFIRWHLSTISSTGSLYVCASSHNLFPACRDYCANCYKTEWTRQSWTRDNGQCIPSEISNNNNSDHPQSGTERRT